MRKENGLFVTDVEQEPIYASDEEVKPTIATPKGKKIYCRTVKPFAVQEKGFYIRNSEEKEFIYIEDKEQPSIKEIDKHIEKYFNSPEYAALKKANAIIYDTPLTWQACLILAGLKENVDGRIRLIDMFKNFKPVNYRNMTEEEFWLVTAGIEDIDNIDLEIKPEKISIFNKITMFFSESYKNISKLVRRCFNNKGK